MTSWRWGAWAANSAAPSPPTVAAVGGQEEERVRERQARCPAGRRVRPRELDEDGRAGGVVVRAGAGAAVVAVGEDDDRLVREPGLLGDEVHERDPPAARDLGGEPLPRDLVAVRRELAREPPGRRGGAGRPRHARGDA